MGRHTFLIAAVVCACALGFFSCTEHETIYEPGIPESQIFADTGSFRGVVFYFKYKSGVTIPGGVSPSVDSLRLESHAVDLAVIPSLNFYVSAKLDTLHLSYQNVLYRDPKGIRIRDTVLDDSTVAPLDNYQPGIGYPNSYAPVTAVYFESSKGNWGRLDLEPPEILAGTRVTTPSSYESDFAIPFRIPYRFLIQENGTNRLY
ncbi:MAG TPA: hypothetical protein VKS81_05865 [Bacteroidota bacterium]|nr:hypothetical protein [Bacteroidota bacterium]